MGLDHLTACVPLPAAATATSAVGISSRARASANSAMVSSGDWQRVSTAIAEAGMAGSALPVKYPLLRLIVAKPAAAVGPSEGLTSW